MTSGSVKRKTIMNKKSLFAVGALVVSTAIAVAVNTANAADPAAGSADKQLQIYPKNLARQQLGTNLFVFNPTSQSYVPTEAAAAWLDDDVATSWPPAPGKSYYLLSFSQAQLITNFSLSTKAGSNGTVTIYASDDLAPPAAKSWTPIVKDISVEAINNKTMDKPFSRMTKYLLIETNIADPSPWYSLYVYGESPSTAYHIEKREKSIDTTPIFGQFVNNGTMFNLSSLYANASVVYSNTSTDPVELQKALDDNAETSITIAPSKTDSGLVVRFAQAQQIQRISVMADPAAKGKLDFFLVNSLPGGSSAPATPTAANDAQFMKVANTIAPTTPAPANGPVQLDGLTPNTTMVLDGSGHNSIDFPAVTCSYMIVRWTPETAGQNLSIAEINSFGDYSLNDYQLISDAPASVAEGPGDAADASKDGDYSKDKQAPPPVAEGPGKDPFVPGGLGFPPNLTHLISP